jgi:hypothetical protein
MMLWPWSRRPAAPAAVDTRQLGPSSGDRTIRLFVSSTFRDLEAERESLRRNVWPILSMTCEERGFGFFETDLRWGVTSVEAESGLILPICLEQIDRCRPFILGIIGNRYGGAGDRDAEVLNSNERYRVLLPYAGRAITELELRYASVNRPPETPAPVALIYGRPGWQRAHSAVGQGDNYASLIAELAGAGIRVRPTPDDLSEFVRLVREDLVAVLDHHLPPRDEPQTRPLREHPRTAHILGYRFVERPALGQLRKLINRRVPRVAIVGPPGSGKTMLAAGLERSYVRGEEGLRVASAIRPAGWRDWTEAFAAIGAQLGVAESAMGSAREGFSSALATLRQPTLIIIDGVDDRNLSSAGTPAWLPDSVPGATIVVGLRAEAASREALRHDRWHVVELGPLAPPELVELADRFFAPLGRRLDAAQTETIASRPRLALEMAVLLNEIRCVPRFEALDPAVKRLAGLAGTPELLDAAIDRLRAEHGAAAEAILIALALAPDGVADSVLPLLAGETHFAPLPPLRLELLRLAMEGITLDHGNRLTLRSAALREQILHRLLPRGSEAARMAVIGRLAGALDRPGAAEESLRQLLVLRRWQDLERLLSDPVVFDGMARRARQQLRSYWARLREASPTSRASIYRAWSKGAPPRRRAEAASLAEDLGDPDTAQALAEAVVAEGPGDAFAFAASTLILARLAEARGDFAAAETDLAALEDGPIRHALPETAAHAAMQRARIALAQHGPQAAREAVAAAAARVAEGGDDRLRAIVLETRAAIHLDLSDAKSAAADYTELVATGERLADLAVLAAGEAGLARVALQRGRRREAAENAQRALRFAWIAGDNRILQDALGVSARIAIESGDLDRGGELIRDRRALAERIGDLVGRLEAEVDRARLCALLGDAAEAERIIAGANSTALRCGLTYLAARLLSVQNNGT